MLWSPQVLRILGQTPFLRTDEHHELAAGRGSKNSLQQQSSLLKWLTLASAWNLTVTADKQERKGKQRRHLNSCRSPRQQKANIFWGYCVFVTSSIRDLSNKVTAGDWSSQPKRNNLLPRHCEVGNKGWWEWVCVFWYLIYLSLNEELL